MNPCTASRVPDGSSDQALLLRCTGACAGAPHNFCTRSQDGSYLAELLLDKGYIVHGMKRRASSYNHPRLEHIMDKSYPNSERFHLHYADLIDFGSLCTILRDTQPHEVYNLGAQSHVQVSFQLPQYTADASGVGVMNLLEAIRATGLDKSVRVYQASTSELYGKVHAVPQDEETPFHPRSPYAVAKLYGFWAIKNYREAYNIYACNGILFNHESPRRGEIFVTRKARTQRAWVACCWVWVWRESRKFVVQRCPVATEAAVSQGAQRHFLSCACEWVRGLHRLRSAATRRAAPLPQLCMRVGA